MRSGLFLAILSLLLQGAAQAQSIPANPYQTTVLPWNNPYQTITPWGNGKGNVGLLNPYQTTVIPWNNQIGGIDLINPYGFPPQNRPLLQNGRMLGRAG